MKKLVGVILLFITTIAVSQPDNYDVSVGNGHGFRFWGGADGWKIHFGNGSEYHYGPVTDYSIKTNMDNYSNGRGWTWGQYGQTPVVAINILGEMQIASRFTASSIGVGTTTPDGFQVNTTLSSENTQGINNIRLGILSGTPRLIFDSGGNTPVEIDNYYGQMRIYDPNSLKMVINSNGNVGIGTSQPDSKLTVNGQIHATEVKVTTTVPAPDYVFEKSYKLPTLDEVKSYIDQNKHLPDVPSAQEFEKNGINVSEMNLLLLKKVEELTLYVIELKQENSRQIESLKEEIKQLMK